MHEYWEGDFISWAEIEALHQQQRESEQESISKADKEYQVHNYRCRQAMWMMEQMFAAPYDLFVSAKGIVNAQGTVMADLRLTTIPRDLIGV